MKSVVAFVVSFVMLVLQAGASVAGEKQDAWVEELLLQISELRKNDKDMRQQLEELKNEIQSLRANSNAAKAPLKVDMTELDDHFLGKKDAEWVMIEFSDYECPFCRKHAQKTFPLLRDKYIAPGKLKYVFVDYPLDFHSNAKSAAVAASCAHDQNAFLEMHDRLSDKSVVLNDQTYLDAATALRLNIARFSDCLKDPLQSKKVENTVALGGQMGVQGTPAFFIGREKNGLLTDVKSVSGAQPFASFERILDKLLVESN